ncbi:MAG: hypothetical protein WC615_06810 [Mucilaginibacter sp.]|jgi:hypothetical protein|uniref:hypothetical protein n=1 Tax=Mucilaginibacter sp. TaxID=1882438 RepID=UPI0035626B17
MKKISYLSLLAILIFFSCTSNNHNREVYEQRYDNFNEFNRRNLRNKGWFSNLVSIDAFDLKNDSYLDSFLVFGTHSYTNNKFYDSIFNSPASKRINISLFESQLKKHINRAPDWFIKPPELVSDELVAIQIQRAYIVRLLKNKKIYYIISN